MSKFLKIVIFLSFFILAPILSSRYIFWDPSVFASVAEEKTSDEQLLITVNRNISYQGLRTVIRRIFQVPFDLSYVDVCIENKSSATELDEKTFLKSEAIFKDLNGDDIDIQPLKIGSNSKNCLPVNLDKFILSSQTEPYQFRYLGQGRLPDGSIVLASVKFDIFLTAETKALPSFISRFISSIILTLTIWGILMLLISIYSLFLKLIFDKPSNRDGLVDH